MYLRMSSKRIRIDEQMDTLLLRASLKINHINSGRIYFITFAEKQLSNKEI